MLLTARISIVERLGVIVCPHRCLDTRRQILWAKVLFIINGDSSKRHLTLAKLKSESSSDWKIESEEANVSSPESSLIGLNSFFRDLSLLMSFWKFGAASGLELSKPKPFTLARRRFVASFADDLATASSPSSERNVKRARKSSQKVLFGYSFENQHAELLIQRIRIYKANMWQKNHRRKLLKRENIVTINKTLISPYTANEESNPCSQLTCKGLPESVWTPAGKDCHLELQTGPWKQGNSKRAFRKHLESELTLSDASRFGEKEFRSRERRLHSRSHPGSLEVFELRRSSLHF